MPGPPRWLLRGGVSALAMLACASLGGCGAAPTPAPSSRASANAGPPTVELNPDKLRMIAIDTLGYAEFGAVDTAVGTIDFDQNQTVQIFPPYQGRVLSAGPQLGDHVRKGDVLFTVESPDLMTASAALLTAEASAVQAHKALDRAETLHKVQGFADQSLEAAVQAEAAASATLQQAQQAVAVFGKSPTAVLASHHVDGVLVVRSPIDGIVTARAVQPGLIVQPAAGTAPYVVAPAGRMWMVANAAETDSTHFHAGQSVEVHVEALGNRTLAGTIETVGATVDPQTHTLQLRASVADPDRLLRAGELASFTLHTGAPVRSPAIPADGVVRLGDGTLTAWVTTDRRHFVQRVITVGITRDHLDQVTSGLNPGETVVTRGALYLDNMLSAAPDD